MSYCLLPEEIEKTAIPFLKSSSVAALLAMHGTSSYFSISISSYIAILLACNTKRTRTYGVGLLVLLTFIGLVFRRTIEKETIGIVPL